MTRSCDPRQTLLFNTNCHSIIGIPLELLLKRAMGFDILRNKSASTDYTKAHVGPSLVLAVCLLLYLNLNCALQEHPQDLQISNKSGSKMPPKTIKAILVHSNYIPQVFNPYSDVTMSYFLWAHEWLV